MSFIIAVANQKGGVGKTTTAVNLAVSLAAAERRTLLIDLDPQANASSALGSPAVDGAISSYRIFVDGHSAAGCPLVDPVSPHDLPWLDLVPATIDLAALETELAGTDGRFDVIRDFLAGTRRSGESSAAILEYYDYVILDTPPGIGILSINALAAANLLIIPVQAEYLALEGLTQMLDTVERVRESVNPGLGAIRVVTTMFDARLRLSKAVEDELRAKLTTSETIGIYRTVIPRNVRLAEAPSFGKPILLFDPASSGALAYTELSKEVIEDDKTGLRSRIGLAPSSQIHSEV